MHGPITDQSPPQALKRGHPPITGGMPRTEVPPPQKGGTPQPLWDRTALYRTEAPPNSPGGAPHRKQRGSRPYTRPGSLHPKEGTPPARGWESRPGTERAPPKKHRSGGARGRGCPKPNAGVSHDPRPIPQALTVHRCCWPGSARLDLPAGGGTGRRGGGAAPQRLLPQARLQRPPLARLGSVQHGQNLAKRLVPPPVGVGRDPQRP